MGGVRGGCADPPPPPPGPGWVGGAVLFAEGPLCEVPRGPWHPQTVAPVSGIRRQSGGRDRWPPAAPAPPAGVAEDGLEQLPLVARVSVPSPA